MKLLLFMVFFFAAATYCESFFSIIRRYLQVKLVVEEFEDKKENV